MKSIFKTLLFTLIITLIFLIIKVSISHMGDKEFFQPYFSIIVLVILIKAVFTYWENLLKLLK
jgi:hypothetical protein